MEFGEGERPHLTPRRVYDLLVPQLTRHGTDCGVRKGISIWRVGARDENEVLPYGQARGVMLKWVNLRMTAVFKGSQVISKGLSHNRGILSHPSIAALGKGIMSFDEQGCRASLSNAQGGGECVPRPTCPFAFQSALGPVGRTTLPIHLITRAAG